MTRLVPLPTRSSTSADRGAARPELEVRLQALDGTWETCGVDRLRGVVPENFQASANAWGSDKASFDLRRDPGAIYPDLGAFTPMEAWVGGYKVFAGRVSETPTRDGVERVVNVQCEGWQYHLDDDVYTRAYVHTRLADYQDMRSASDAVLGPLFLNAAGTVANDNGTIALQWGAGVDLFAGACVGVTLDLGAESTGKRIFVQWTGSANTTQVTFHARGSDNPSNSTWTTASTYDDAFSSTVTAAGASGSNAGTFTTARRYIQLFLLDDSFTGTVTADIFMRVVVSLVAADTAYESGNTSTLKASTVVADALSRGQILLNSSTAGISTTTFNIPSLALDGYKTPRQVIEGVNSYHDYLTQVDVDKKLLFSSRPTAPVLEVGNQAGVEFDDASSNDGSEVYSRVIVQAEGPDGAQLNVARKQPTSVLETTAISSPAADNPSFATNTTSWTATAGTLTRTTTAGEFDSGTSGGKLTLPTSGTVLTETFTGTFLAGRTYSLSFRARVNTGQVNFNVNFGYGLNDVGTLQTQGLTTSFQTLTVTWTPAQTRTSGVTLVLLLNPFLISPSGIFYVDTLSLSTTISTFVDRRGFQRTKILPVASALTAEAANQIGDVWLSGHKTTPFKGSLKVTGQGVRKVLGGESVSPWEMLTMSGQKLRFANRVDPDTGGWGRDGTIASVTYDHDACTSSIEIDSPRGNFDALLSRLAVIQGG